MLYRLYSQIFKVTLPIFLISISVSVNSCKAHHKGLDEGSTVNAVDIKSSGIQDEELLEKTGHGKTWNLCMKNLVKKILKGSEFSGVNLNTKDFSWFLWASGIWYNIETSHKASKINIRFVAEFDDDQVGLGKCKITKAKSKFPYFQITSITEDKSLSIWSSPSHNVESEYVPVY